MHNSVLEDVSHHKHLGLVLSNNLCWTNHIDEVYVKAMKRLDIIQSLNLALIGIHWSDSIFPLSYRSLNMVI